MLEESENETQNRPAIPSYSQLFPAILLAYAGAGKLKGTIAYVDLFQLSPLEFLTGFGFPLIELLIAVLLVLAPNRIVLSATLLLFTIYSGYLIQLLWNGGTSCKCTGATDSNALTVLGLDLFSITAVLLHREMLYAYRNKLLLATAILLVPVSSFIWIINPMFAAALATAMNPGPIRSEFEKHSNVPCTSQFEAKVILGNRTSQPLEIDSLMVSCGCTHYRPEKLTLSPGGSETVFLRVDLNKSFQDATEKEGKVEVGAGCFDKQLRELDQITLFSASTFRHFAITQPRISYLWTTEQDQVDLTVPIRWFLTPEANSVVVNLEGRLIKSSLTSTNELSINVDRPKRSFETRKYRVVSTQGGVETDAEVQVDLVVNTSELAHNLKMIGQPNVVQTVAKVRDVNGSEVSRLAESDSPFSVLQRSETLFDRSKAPVDIQFEVVDSSGFVQQLTVPILERP